MLLIILLHTRLQMQIATKQMMDRCTTIVCYTSTLCNIRRMHNLSRKNIYNRYIIYPSYKTIITVLIFIICGLQQVGKLILPPKNYAFLRRFISRLAQMNSFNISALPAASINNLQNVLYIYFFFFLSVEGIFATKHSESHWHSIVYAASQNGHFSNCTIEVESYYSIERERVLIELDTGYKIG